MKKITALLVVSVIALVILTALYGLLAMVIAIALWGLALEVGYAVCERELRDLVRQTDALLDVLNDKSPGGDYAAW